MCGSGNQQVRSPYGVFPAPGQKRAAMAQASGMAGEFSASEGNGIGGAGGLQPSGMQPYAPVAGATVLQPSPFAGQSMPVARQQQGPSEGGGFSTTAGVSPAQLLRFYSSMGASQPSFSESAAKKQATVVAEAENTAAGGKRQQSVNFYDASNMNGLIAPRWSLENTPLAFSTPRSQSAVPPTGASIAMREAARLANGTATGAHNAATQLPAGSMAQIASPVLRPGALQNPQAGESVDPRDVRNYDPLKPYHASGMAALDAKGGNSGLNPQQLAGAIGQLSNNLAEMPYGVLHGAVEAANEFVDLVHDMGNAANGSEYVRNPGSRLQPFKSVAKAPGSWVPLVPPDFRMPPPETPAGNALSSISQFMTGYYTGGKFLKGLGAASKIGVGLKSMAQGFLAQFAFVDEQEARFADLLQSLGVANPIAPENNPWKGGLKVHLTAWASAF